MLKKIVLVLFALVLVLINIAYAKVSLEAKKQITPKETEVERVIKSILIEPEEKRVTVRTEFVYYDSKGEIIRKEPGQVIDLIDRDAVSVSPHGKEEALTEYTDFIKNATIDFNKIIQAIPKGE